MAMRNWRSGMTLSEKDAKAVIFCKNRRSRIPLRPPRLLHNKNATHAWNRFGLIAELQPEGFSSNETTHRA